jgi:hypothetical protein
VQRLVQPPGPTSARQSAFAVHAVCTADWQEPPAPIAVWKHVSHAPPGVAFAGVGAHSSVAHAVWQGALHASMVPPEELPLLLELLLPLLLPELLPPSGVVFDEELLEHPPVYTVSGTTDRASSPNKRFTFTAFLRW